MGEWQIEKELDIMKNNFNNAREIRRQIFIDTKKQYETNKQLIEGIEFSKKNQKVIREEDEIENPKEEISSVGSVEIVISKKRSLEAASAYKDYKVCVHNFASATNPGGGVERGSSAQEEALCRCSTLFPCISAQETRTEFHEKHRSMLKNKVLDARYNDDCIYTPDVIVFKSDEDTPKLLAEEMWYKVDIISCAAPNLREKPSNAMNPYSGTEKLVINSSELLNLHMKRLRRILDIAKLNGAQVVILGAFGCGAFQNSPEIVANAMAHVIPDYRKYFKVIEFAIYCPPKDTTNYEVFSHRLKNL